MESFASLMMNLLQSSSLIFDMLLLSYYNVLTPLVTRDEVEGNLACHAVQAPLIQFLISTRPTCIYIVCCLQCFDAVGWAAGRASGL